MYLTIPIETDDKKIPGLDKDFITYHCPHCDKPFAKGILISVKMVCPHCYNFFVVAGIEEEPDK